MEKKLRQIDKLNVRTTTKTTKFDCFTMCGFRMEPIFFEWNFFFQSLKRKSKTKSEKRNIFSCVVSRFIVFIMFVSYKKKPQDNFFSATLFPLHLNVIVDLFQIIIN